MSRKIITIVASIVGVLALTVFIFIKMMFFLYPAKTDEALEKTFRGLEATSTPTTTTDKIPEKPALISKDAALEMVKKRTEVIKYVYELEKSGSKAQFRVQDGGATWDVQVFEVVNKPAPGHTATFNWYSVHKNTGKITPQF